MTGQQIIDDVRNELLEPIAGFWSDAELLNWINRAEQDFVNRTRMLESSSTANTETGVEKYPLPSNWLSAVGIFYHDVAGGADKWYELEPTDLQRISRENGRFLSTNSADFNRPRQYWIWDKAIHLSPTPDVDGDANLRMFFKAKPVPLTTAADSINLDDSLAGALRAFVLWKAWTKEKELELAQDQMGVYEGYVRNGLRWVKLQSLNKRHNIDVRSGFPYFPGA